MLWVPPTELYRTLHLNVFFLFLRVSFCVTFTLKVGISIDCFIQQLWNDLWVLNEIFPLSPYVVFFIKISLLSTCLSGASKFYYSSAFVETQSKPEESHTWYSTSISNLTSTCPQQPESASNISVTKILAFPWFCHVIFHVLLRPLLTWFSFRDLQSACDDVRDKKYSAVVAAILNRIF